jgi:hypothetical protein
MLGLFGSLSAYRTYQDSDGAVCREVEAKKETVWKMLLALCHVKAITEN